MGEAEAEAGWHAGRLRGSLQPSASAPPPQPLLLPPCSLLREREAELHALAQALLRAETLTQAEIREVLAGMGSPVAALPGEAPRPVPVPAPAAAAAASAASVLVPAGADAPPAA